MGTNGDGVADEIERNLISGNTLRGVVLQVGASNNLISGNYVGTNVAGEFALPNQQQGIRIDSGTQNTVAGNLVSGNGRSGVWLTGAGTAGNLVQGNFIGTDAAGAEPIANGTYGIAVTSSSSSNIIGTDSDGLNDSLEGNLISGNTMSGIWLSGAGTNQNIVAGNQIGTNASGSSPLGNLQDGVLITGGAAENQIGGTTDASNTIAFNTGAGVMVRNTPSTGNRIQANAIYSNGALGIDISVIPGSPDGVTSNDLGDADDDILIAGYVDFGTADEKMALDAVMAEWLSARDFQQRVANLRDGSGSVERFNNGSFLQKGVTVFDDGARDLLTGCAGLDWFLLQDQEDKQTDLSDAEFADALDFFLAEV